MKLAFGSVIAVVLLGLYCYAVAVAVGVAGAPPPASHALSEGMRTTLSTIGGLIAALVIAELAITKPGEAPLARVLATDLSVTATRLVKVVTGIYLAVWAAAGITAYVVGYLWHPGVVPALTDLGQSWLGIAVASCYAYFGISPNPERSA